MRIQVLVAAMHQTDYSLLDKMNIQTDAIVGNQCERNEIATFEYNGNVIHWLSFKERGVGLNRNNTLMRATADICLLADDDMVFHADYVEKVEKAFADNPTADVIIFNIDEIPAVRFVNTKTRKINRFNYGRYGAARIAFRRDKVALNGISFNLSFGGGAKYSAGEDSLFLNSCLKQKLKIVAVPYSIATLEENRESTWFKGYTEKFFFDKGVLFYCLNKRWCTVRALVDCIRHRKKYKSYGARKAYKTIKEGIKSVK